MPKGLAALATICLVVVFVPCAGPSKARAAATPDSQPPSPAEMQWEMEKRKRERAKARNLIQESKIPKEEVLQIIEDRKRQNMNRNNHLRRQMAKPPNKNPHYARALENRSSSAGPGALGIISLLILVGAVVAAAKWSPAGHSKKQSSKRSKFVDTRAQDHFKSYSIDSDPPATT